MRDAQPLDSDQGLFCDFGPVNPADDARETSFTQSSHEPASLMRSEFDGHLWSPTSFGCRLLLKLSQPLLKLSNA